MCGRLRRVLILDTDPEVLITLQCALEQSEINTTITWDESEACQLIGTAHFDLMLVGDHPPELDAAAILDDLSFRGTCPPVLILRTVISEKDKAYFHRLGAIAVVEKRDPVAVLDEVTKALAAMELKSATTGLSEVHSLMRAAS